MGSIEPTRTTLRVAILECDEPAAIVQEKYGRYGAMFTRLLEAGAQRVQERDPDIAIDFDITTWDVVNTEHYPRMEDVDAVLITGSKYDSFQSHPWILKLVAFTKEVLAQDRVRLIGVCFGHQIIGRAMGVEVGRNEAGWEISVVSHELTEKGKSMFELDELNLHQMHQDIVYEWPPNVQALAHTSRCQVQAMYEPKRIISVQGHPEFNEEIVKVLLQRRYAQGIFYQQLYDEAMSRVHKKHDGTAVAAAFVRFLLE